MSAGPKPQTAFRFDMMPWKLVFCQHSLDTCTWSEPGDGEGPIIPMDSLPKAPEPGRIPPGADHVHIVAKYSGERDAREEEKWRALIKAAARCVHGRMMGDICNKCPGRISLDRTGEWVGSTSDGRMVTVPPRDQLDDIRAWTTR